MPAPWKPAALAHALALLLVAGMPIAAAAQKGSGTGFLVDGAGHVLTNAHVAGKCAMVVVGIDGKRLSAVVVSRNAQLDLALLATRAFTPTYATFRAGAPARAGEAVTAAGFPLRGLLASGPIVTTGIVNATAGLLDDRSRLQISAAVQPGNSGGPLLDAAGNVIGVVVSKLDAMEVAKSTGDLPQNVNFAIKGERARAFLEANRIVPRTGPWTRPIDPVGVAAIAKAIAVPVECQ
jgi:S1-C subfamily serine protease